MEKAKHSIEFEAEINREGRVQFSRTVAHELHLKEGSKVTVRIIGGVLSRELTARDVSDEEVEHIGTIQFEDREHVVRFLRSEGALMSNGRFRMRVKGRTA